MANKTPKLDNAATVIPISSIVSKYLAPKPFNNTEVKSKVIGLIDKAIKNSEDRTIEISSVKDLETLVKLRIMLQTLYPDKDVEDNTDKLNLDMDNPLVKRLAEDLFISMNENNDN